MENTHKSHALIFKALCDENRLAILEQLREGEKCACELIEKTKVAQSALSYHMKILCEANIVQSRQEGKWTHYSISVQGIGSAAETLKRYVPKGVIQLGDEGCCASL